MQNNRSSPSPCNRQHAPGNRSTVLERSIARSSPRSIATQSLLALSKQAKGHKGTADETIPAHANVPATEDSTTAGASRTPSPEDSTAAPEDCASALAKLLDLFDPKVHTNTPMRDRLLPKSFYRTTCAAAHDAAMADHVQHAKDQTASNTFALPSDGPARPEAETRKIVSQLSRQALEALVVESVVSKKHITPTALSTGQRSPGGESVGGGSSSNSSSASSPAHMVTISSTAIESSETAEAQVDTQPTAKVSSPTAKASPETAARTVDRTPKRHMSNVPKALFLDSAGTSECKSSSVLSSTHAEAFAVATSKTNIPGKDTVRSALPPSTCSLCSLLPHSSGVESSLHHG